MTAEALIYDAVGPARGKGKTTGVLRAAVGA
jgi:hypothetical protein